LFFVNFQKTTFRPFFQWFLFQALKETLIGLMLLSWFNSELLAKLLPLESTSGFSQMLVMEAGILLPLLEVRIYSRYFILCFFFTIHSCVSCHWKYYSLFFFSVLSFLNCPKFLNVSRLVSACLKISFSSSNTLIIFIDY